MDPLLEYQGHQLVVLTEAVVQVLTVKRGQPHCA